MRLGCVSIGAHKSGAAAYGLVPKLPAGPVTVIDDPSLNALCELAKPGAGVNPDGAPLGGDAETVTMADWAADPPAPLQVSV